MSWLELQLSLQRDGSLGWLSPTFSRLPRLCLGAAENLLSPSRSPSREKAVEGQGQRSPGSRIYSNSCQNWFDFLKNNHNAWVKNQFVTRHQPQSEPPQEETGVPDRVLQP